LCVHLPQLAAPAAVYKKQGFLNLNQCCTILAKCFFETRKSCTLIFSASGIMLQAQSDTDAEVIAER
jgi:hypothetical protein